MTFLAAGLLLVLVLVVSFGAGLIRSQQRAHARREDLLLNQLLNAVGKPWLPAPADETVEPEPWLEAGRFVASPEQYA